MRCGGLELAGIDEHGPKRRGRHRDPEERADPARNRMRGLEMGSGSFDVEELCADAAENPVPVKRPLLMFDALGDAHPGVCVLHRPRDLTARTEYCPGLELGIRLSGEPANLARNADRALVDSEPVFERSVNNDRAITLVVTTKRRPGCERGR